MPPGERWGAYLLEARIGAGGMAEVFRARREGAAAFRKLVCIKRLHEHLANDRALVELFLDEARTGAKLRHRGIVAIDDLGEHAGRFFIAMEYVNGVDLAQLEARLGARGAVFPADAAVYVAHELLAALHAAHTAVDPDDGHPLSVVHRDVSPHNVLVSYAGEIKLTDFGIARAARRASVTAGATVRGRFGYMPVEQASGGPLDARADLFALGVVLFELLTGRRPYRGEDPDAPMEAILVAQITGDRPSLASLRADVPKPLERLVEWLLAGEASQRPASAADALALLEPLAERVTGANTLATLLGTLYPSHASTAAAPRISLAPAPAPTPVHAAPSAGASSASAQLISTPFSPPRDATSVALGDRYERDAPRRSPVAVAVALTLALLFALGATATLARRLTRTPHSPRVLEPTAPMVTLRPATLPARTPPPTLVRAVMVASASTTALPERPRVPVTVAPRASARPREPSSAPSVALVAAAAPTTEPPRAAPSPVPSTIDEAPTLGVLRVVATPWGEVFIDGHARGRAPFDDRISVGEHTVRVTGGVEHTERVRVSAARPTVVRASAGDD